MTKFIEKIKAYALDSKKVSEDAAKNMPQAVFKYSIDSPSTNMLSSRKLEVRGWILPKDNRRVVAVRVRNNSAYKKIDYGVERPDVLRAFPDLERKRTVYSGFFGVLDFEDGNLDIEADFGDGFEVIYSAQLLYYPEKLYETYYNPDLSVNWAEHQNLLDNRKKYYYEDSRNYKYKRHEGDPKLVAFYLPQFHPIPENDKAWGKGFTEWTNVTAAQPRFVGHQQPLLPGDLGFYDLRIEDNIQKQVELAKDHGIYGFCFYYYWFSGKRLLEKPLDAFLKHKEWNFNFMICWANENWTRRWDGRDKDVIIAQKYLNSDPINFIKDVEHILLDPRYIKRNGKPVLAVYRGSELGVAERYAKIWREYFKKQHGQELELVSMLNFDATNPREYGFDTGVEFAPISEFQKSGFSIKNSRIPNLKKNLIDIDFVGHVADYRVLFHANKKRKEFNFPTYKSLTPSWDNEARKKGKKSLTLYGANPDLYANWLDQILEAKIEEDKDPLVFVNAWNEWAEGSMLEPTIHFGHAVLNRTTEVLAKHSVDKTQSKKFLPYGIKKNSKSETAVIVHIYYEEEWEYIRKKLRVLDKVDYDLFITITKKNQALIPKIRKEIPWANINFVPNRGRDILPFLFVAQRIRKLGYQYVLKLHTKKSRRRNSGADWFQELINNLLPSKSKVQEIISCLQSGAAIIGPAGHYVELDDYSADDDNRLGKCLENILGQNVVHSAAQDKKKYAFFAGAMFWARFDAIMPVLDRLFIPEDFESEKGQTNATMAQMVERLITVLPAIEGKDIYKVSYSTIDKISERDIIKDYRYARK